MRRRRDALIDCTAAAGFEPSEPAGCTLAGGTLPGWIDRIVTTWAVTHLQPTAGEPGARRRRMR